MNWNLEITFFVNVFWNKSIKYVVGITDYSFFMYSLTCTVLSKWKDARQMGERQEINRRKMEETVWGWEMQLINFHYIIEDYSKIRSYLYIYTEESLMHHITYSFAYCSWWSCHKIRSFKDKFQFGHSRPILMNHTQKKAQNSTVQC